MAKLDIGAAMAALKEGRRVRRAGWTDIDFIYLVDNSRFTVSRPPLSNHFEGAEVRYSAHIDAFRRTPDVPPGAAEFNVHVWQQRQEDILANDWELVD